MQDEAFLWLDEKAAMPHLRRQIASLKSNSKRQRRGIESSSGFLVVEDELLVAQRIGRYWRVVLRLKPFSTIERIVTHSGRAPSPAIALARANRNGGRPVRLSLVIVGHQYFPTCQTIRSRPAKW